MLNFIKTYIKSIFVVAVITLVFLTIYVAVQQDLRQSANDPQIQAAEDVSVELAGGAPPQQIVSGNTLIDMSKTLSPFIIIFDGSDKVVVSSAQLNGPTPIPPAGVFAYAKKNGEDRFTWEPAPGVREAAVVTYSSGATPYYVLVGRSLKEVEKRESQTQAIAFGGWLVSIAGYLGFMAVNEYLVKKSV